MSVKSESWFNQGAGEEVLWYSHPSFVIKLPRLLLGVGIAILALAGAVYGYFAAGWPTEVIYSLLGVVPVGILYTIYELLVFKNTWYVITTQRVIHKSKVIGQDKTSKPHKHIVHFDTKVNIMDTLLSYLTPEDIGDLVLRTSDDRGELFVMAKTPTVGLAESHLERMSSTANGSTTSPAHPSNTPPEAPDGSHTQSTPNSQQVNHSSQQPDSQPQPGEETPPQSQRQPETSEPQHSAQAESSDEQSEDGLDEFEPSEYA